MKAIAPFVYGVIACNLVGVVALLFGTIRGDTTAFVLGLACLTVGGVTIVTWPRQ